MALVNKQDPKKIFASQAPSQDVPAEFNNYERGWDESRKNNGKPTIKQFNKLQQLTDEKILWMHQNGAALPFDETMEYAEGAVVVKDGVLQQWNGGAWRSVVAEGLSDTIQTFNTTEAGVDPVTGVANGAYFNVRSSSDESYVDEYQNVGGVATPTGKSYPTSAFIAVFAEKTNIIDSKLKRENVSVWDFFTPAELDGYNADTNRKTFDSYRPIQEFFTYISENDVGTAYCSGDFLTTRSILVGGANGCLTKVVVGNVKISAKQESVMEEIIAFETERNFKWLGHLWVEGGTENNSRYTRRTVRNGVRIGRDGSIGATHSYFLSIQAHNGFKEFGVKVENLCTGVQIDKIRFTRCGSGWDTTDGTAHLVSYSVKANFSNREEISGTSTQRTIVTVDNLPDFSRSFPLMMYIEGDNENLMYVITDVDSVNKKITVQPRINDTITSGVLRYVFGGGVGVTGSDSSLIKLGQISGLVSSVAVSLQSLYPPVIDSITSESNLVGLLLGGSRSSGFVGGGVNELYSESSKFDILQYTQYNDGFTFYVNTNVSVLPSRCATMSGYRAADNTLNGVTPLLVRLGYKSQMLSQDESYMAASASVDITSYFRNVVHVSAANPVINLTEPNRDLQRLYNYTRRQLLATTNTGGIPATVTFNAPSGYTVNGSSQAVFNGFSSQPLFELIAPKSGTNLIVTCLVNAVRTASVVYDPPSLSAAGTEGDTVTTVVTLTGATLGDAVSVGFSRYNAAIDISAQVSAANTVTVKFRNTSSAPIDLASGTLKVKLV